MADPILDALKVLIAALRKSLAGLGDDEMARWLRCCFTPTSNPATPPDNPPPLPDPPPPPPPVDSTAPTLNGAPTGSLNQSNEPVFIWPAASDNVAVVGYVVSINGGADILVGNVLTYRVASAADGTYNLKYAALDAIGNRSAYSAVSNTLTVATPGADPSVRSSSTNTGQGGTQPSVASPAGATTGDVLYFIFGANLAQGSVNDNNGLTPTDLGILVTENAALSSLCVRARRLVAGDPSTWNFNLATPDRWTVHCLCIQHPHPTVLFDVAPILANFLTQSGGSATMTAPSITSTVDKGIDVVITEVDAASTAINATPAGYTVQQNSGNQRTAVATKIITPAGPTGTRQYGYASAQGAIVGSFVIPGLGDVGSPTEPPPAPNSKAALLAYLVQLGTAPIATRHILTGQHVDYWMGPNTMQILTDLFNQTGKRPAILGTTVNIAGNPGIDGVGQSNAQLAAGGIVSFGWWAGNPNSGIYTTDEVNRNINIANLLVPGTLRNNWLATLDILASKFKAINGPVLFRPFHELNGNWFWWGARPAADFIAMWRDMHTYLTVTKGVSNLLWMYNVNGGVGNYATYYPGSAYADIVSIDIYGTNPGGTGGDQQAYADLIALNKPFMMAETGVVGAPAQPALNSASNNTRLINIKNNFPKCIADICFCQNWALSRQQQAVEYMNNPVSINRTDLPSGIT